jgi:hypothetical protein
MSTLAVGKIQRYPLNRALFWTDHDIIIGRVSSQSFSVTKVAALCVFPYASIENRAHRFPLHYRLNPSEKVLPALRSETMLSLSTLPVRSKLRDCNAKRLIRLKNAVNASSARVERPTFAQKVRM